jgi:hypothetical protein
MEKVREVAVACIGRAVMFGTLAIGCVMVGFSFSPVSAFRSGALMALGMSAVLIWKALAAHRQHPKTTEVWLYLDDENRPSGDRARQAFSSVLAEVYASYARFSLLAACGLFAIALVFLLFGHEAYQPPLPS